MESPADVDPSLAARAQALEKGLGENLFSCILYGSAVRGNVVPGVSDINLLLVLRESTPEAHGVIAKVIAGKPPIEPFILGRRGLERSLRSFAIKFRSIQRNYRVLHGADPLADLKVPEEVVRMECEQVLRNIRLRVVHAFVTTGAAPRAYSAYLVEVTADVFVAVSEPLRLEGIAVPQDLAARVPIIADALGADPSILRDLLDLKARRGTVSASQAIDFHGRLFRLLDKAVGFIEARWPI